TIGGYFTIHTGSSGETKTTEALLQQIRSLDGIDCYNGLDTYYMYAAGLDLIPGSYSGTGLVGESMPKLIGCTDTSMHEKFIASSFQLEDGRHVTAEDEGKAVISEKLAMRNGLEIGDRIITSAVEGVRDWPPHALGAQAEYEIVGIYSMMRYEPVSPSTPECDIPENAIFTDISTAKRLYSIKFPDRTPDAYYYTSGLMLFPEDPAEMSEIVAALKQQPYADWDDLVISENSAAYEQAATPIHKIGTISLILLLVILVISIGILSLTLLMWTRERMTEIGILISLGLSAKGICKQLLLENYIVAAPSFVVAVLISTVLSGQIGIMLGGMLTNVRPDAVQAGIVLVCAAAVILLTTLLASVTIMRKKPKEILTDLS
ncbi:MAG: ABC transporter permease, partial [Butyricicoccus sp.]|nr:ABC transporter permease [Butyricicoccus sp.]